MWRIKYRCWPCRIRRCYGPSLRLRKTIKPLVVIFRGGSWVGVRNSMTRQQVRSCVAKADMNFWNFMCFEAMTVNLARVKSSTLFFPA